MTTTKLHPRTIPMPQSRDTGIILAILCVMFLLGTGAAQRAQAQTFVYTMQGTASGTLNQNSSTSSFSNAPYTFSVTVDPATVISNGGDHYTGWSTVDSVSIDGVTGTFTNAVMVEVFNNGSFSWVSIAQELSPTSYFAFLTGYSGTLSTYDLKSAIGPLTLSAPGVNAFHPSIVTSFGSFVLTSVSTMTFSAATTPQGATQVIVTQVNSLLAQGVINKGQDNSLVNQLQHAIRMMNAGKINGAIGNLESFISEVNDLYNSGVLTADQWNELISAANSVITELQTP